MSAQIDLAPRKRRTDTNMSEQIDFYDRGVWSKRDDPIQGDCTDFERPIG